MDHRRKSENSHRAEATEEIEEYLSGKSIRRWTGDIAAMFGQLSLDCIESKTLAEACGETSGDVVEGDSVPVQITDFYIQEVISGHIDVYGIARGRSRSIGTHP